MALSILRFWWNGWIEKLYLEPDYFFSYRYFEWVKPLGNWTYALFAIAFISATMVMLGWKYRLAITVFFLSFTYIELMDKTTYLNHYYFVSLLGFVLIWLPAADYFSIDRGADKSVTVPRWTINCLKVFVGVVYFYAGLAKLKFGCTSPSPGPGLPTISSLYFSSSGALPARWLSLPWLYSMC